MTVNFSDINDGFHFCWNIENIDMCFYEKRVTSPTFVANNMNQTEWSISLHPFLKENMFMISLNRIDNEIGIGVICIDFELLVTTSNGMQKVLNEKKMAEFQAGTSKDYYWIYRSREILHEDMTITCHMLLSGKETLPYIRCWARTVFGKEQRSGVWKVQGFSYLPSRQKNTFILRSTLKQSPHIEISGMLSKTSRFFHIELQVTHDKHIFLFGKISLLTAKGKLKWPTKESFSFDNSTSSQTFKFPLILKPIMLYPEFSYSRPNDYLPEGALTLLCEFDVSTGVQFSKITESNYLSPEFHRIRRLISKDKSQELLLNTKDTDVTDEISVSFHKSYCTPQALKQDLKNFYKQKKHCDITLHCENKTFPAHKSILCSRSSVFGSMFDHEMKENINKKVDIVDMDADTLDCFLLFLYSETLEDFQWDRATKLLYAANKYQVESLKKECSSFIMSNLSLFNICEALVLADLYEHEQMRTKCQDFISENAAEVFCSKEWELFTVDDPLLSARVLQRYFYQKK